MMKTLQIISAIAFIAGIAIVSNQLKVEPVESNYNPRSAQSVEHGYAGAAEHYAMMRQNIETGETRREDYLNMQAAVNKRSKSSSEKDLGLNLSWQKMGPTNYGGRTRDICITQNGLVYTGSVSGGLYRSWDYGNTWHYVTGFKDNLNVTSVEQAGNGTLFVGTGSFFDNHNGAGSSGFYGSGVYKSSDNGDTWIKIDGLSNDLGEDNGDFTFVDALLADKNDPNKMWIGSRGGLYLYDDSNDQIVDDFDGLGFTSVGKELVSSSDGNTMMAVLGQSVYISNNGGENWTNVSGNNAGEIPLSGVRRVGVAISPEDPDYMYALVSLGQGRMGGVYASTDRGNTWFNIWPANDLNNSNIGIDPFGFNQQGWYDLAISVFPNNKEQVLVGGVTLWKGGINIQPELLTTGAGFGPGYVHADIHHFEWKNNELFIACDGGIFTSNDIAVASNPTFVDSSFGYNTTQFFGIGVSTTGKVNGGTQDNSTFLVNSVSTTGINQYEGDGFDSDISAVNDNVQFASSQFGSVARSFDGGNSFSGFYDDELAEIDQNGLNFPFHTLLRLYENTDDEFSQQTMTFIATEELYEAGTTVTFKTNNLNQSFEYELQEDLVMGEELQITDPYTSLFAIYSFDGVYVTRDALNASTEPDWTKVIDDDLLLNAIEFSTDGNHMFLGTELGEVYRVSGFNNFWGDNDLENLTVTRIFNGLGPVMGIGPDPTNADRVAIALGGYGGAGKVWLSESATTAVETSSSGEFENIWFNGELSGMPCYDVIIADNQATGDDLILVATEFGIWGTDDISDNESWEQCSDHVGNTPVFAIRQQYRGPQQFIENPTNTGMIYVGSHGKGVWRTAGAVGVNEVSTDLNGNNGDLSLYPNPATDVVNFELDLESAVQLNLEIYTITGKLVKSENLGRISAGTQTLSAQVNELSAGNYVLRVSGKGVSKTGKLLVKD